MITVTQNEPLQLDRLAAMRQLYSNAKSAHGAQLIGGALVVGLFSVLVLVDSSIRPWAALWSLSFTLTDLIWLEPRVKKLRSTAAKIQELFDCEVLQLSWNHLKVGPKPDGEEVAMASKRHKMQDLKWEQKLLDWYPPSVSEVSSALARLICQRASCRWDSALRRRYATAIGWSLAAMAAIVIVLSLVGNVTFANFILSGVAPLIPMVALGTRQFRDQREAADRADRLKLHLDNLWDREVSNPISAEVYEADLRSSQDEIYEHRSRSPLIFDWLYWRLRRDDEEAMNITAGHLVAEAKRRRGRPAGS